MRENTQGECRCKVEHAKVGRAVPSAPQQTEVAGSNGLALMFCRRAGDSSPYLCITEFWDAVERALTVCCAHACFLQLQSSSREPLRSDFGFTSRFTHQDCDFTAALSKVSRAAFHHWETMPRRVARRLGRHQSARPF